jgi:hypothetical protein
MVAVVVVRTRSGDRWFCLSGQGGILFVPRPSDCSRSSLAYSDLPHFLVHRQPFCCHLLAIQTVLFGLIAPSYSLPIHPFSIARKYPLRLPIFRRIGHAEASCFLSSFFLGPPCLWSVSLEENIISAPTIIIVFHSNSLRIIVTNSFFVSSPCVLWRSVQLGGESKRDDDQVLQHEQYAPMDDFAVQRVLSRPKHWRFLLYGPC